MIHIYKAGGIRNRDGKDYTIKAINEIDNLKYLADGWVSSLDEVKAPKVVSEVKSPKETKQTKKVNKNDNQK